MKQLTFTIEVHEAEEGEVGFWVSVPALPGCFSQGATYEAAVENAREAVQCHVEAMVERGEAIPEESSEPSMIGGQAE